MNCFDERRPRENVKGITYQRTASLYVDTVVVGGDASRLVVAIAMIQGRSKGTYHILTNIALSVERTCIRCMMGVSHHRPIRFHMVLYKLYSSSYKNAAQRTVSFVNQPGFFVRAVQNFQQRNWTNVQQWRGYVRTRCGCRLAACMFYSSEQTTTDVPSYEIYRRRIVRQQ